MDPLNNNNNNNNPTNLSPASGTSTGFQPSPDPVVAPSSPASAPIGGQMGDISTVNWPPTPTIGLETPPAPSGFGPTPWGATSSVGVQPLPTWSQASPSDSTPNLGLAAAPDESANSTAFGLSTSATPNAASMPTPTGVPSWVLTPNQNESSSGQATAEMLTTSPAAPQAPDEGQSLAGTPMPQESAPTDLSHLMDVPSAAPVSTAQPETLVVPQSTAETNQAVTSSGSKGFPKIAILVGGLLLLLVVAGASAYFILGVGQPVQPQTSVPAEQQRLTNPPKSVLPTTSPPATPSAENNSFGTLTGQATPSASPTKAATTSAQSGTSAIDLLRQRGQ